MSKSALGRYAKLAYKADAWIDAGLPSLTLAVNVSPHQFRRSDINNLVAEVLHEPGFPAKRLELELTESGLMENEEKAVEVLNNLCAQGARLAIDDFGIGYSSLAYLKRFPPDALKIDKSFIDDHSLSTRRYGNYRDDYCNEAYFRI